MKWRDTRRGKKLLKDRRYRERRVVDNGGYDSLKDRATGCLILFTVAFCATAVLIAVAVIKGVI